MAGGEGTRLKAVTGDMPKPWLDQLPSALKDQINEQRDKTRSEILRFLRITPWVCTPDHQRIRLADAAAFAIEVNYFDKTNLDQMRRNTDAHSNDVQRALDQSQ